MAKTLRSWHGTRPVTEESKSEGSFITRLERRVFGDEVFVEIQGDMERYTSDLNAKFTVWIGGTGVGERIEVSDPQEADTCFNEVVEDLMAAGYTGAEDTAR